jgi:hypothetical protein
VPINLRPRAEQGLRASTGNRATGVMVRLPLGERDPVALFHEIHARVTERKAQPLVEHLPDLAELLAVLPRPLFRYLSRAGSQAVNLIVTNVPGIMQPRYVAERITAGTLRTAGAALSVSIALYGYDQRLVGIDADPTAMPTRHAFEEMLRGLQRTQRRIETASRAARRRVDRAPAIRGGSRSPRWWFRARCATRCADGAHQVHRNDLEIGGSGGSQHRGAGTLHLPVLQPSLRPKRPHARRSGGAPRP